MVNRVNEMKKKNITKLAWVFTKIRFVKELLKQLKKVEDNRKYYQNYNLLYSPLKGPNFI